MAWSITQMAQMSGIPTDSLRYYDKLGIVSPKRAENGYRRQQLRGLLCILYGALSSYKANRRPQQANWLALRSG